MLVAIGPQLVRATETSFCGQGGGWLCPVHPLLCGHAAKPGNMPTQVCRTPTGSGETKVDVCFLRNFAGSGGSWAAPLLALSMVLPLRDTGPELSVQLTWALGLSQADRIVGGGRRKGPESGQSTMCPINHRCLPSGKIPSPQNVSFCVSWKQFLKGVR